MAKNFCALFASYPEARSEDEQTKRQKAAINRFLGTLKNLQKEVALSGMLSTKLLKDLEKLVADIEAELTG